VPTAIGWIWFGLMGLVSGLVAMWRCGDVVWWFSGEVVAKWCGGFGG